MSNFSKNLLPNQKACPKVSTFPKYAMPPLGNNGSKGESRDEEKYKGTFKYKFSDDYWFDGGPWQPDDGGQR
jgi:hypothetical protein